MRILHFADVHIGVENYSRTDPETGLSTRLGDFLKTFDDVVSFALSEQIDLVLFCGDAYKTRDPNQTHQREFAKRIARLADKDISVFLVVGNHDTPNVIGRATAIEIFRTLDVPNVHIGDSLDTYQIQTSKGPVQIIAVPWIRRSAFLTREETRGLTPDQVTDEIQMRLARMIGTQAKNLDNQIPAILAGHMTVSGAETSSEQSMMLGRDPVLLKSDVALPEFDYVALGHMHRHQIIGTNPLVVYSGSLQRIDFGEEQDEKGFCVIDLDSSKPTGSRIRQFSFHKIDARKFLTIEIKIPPNDLDPTSTVLKTISNHHISGKIVRLRITIPSELGNHLEETRIREALEDAHFVASISKEILGTPRTRLGSTPTEGLNPKEALKLYLENRNITQTRSDILIQHAEELMREQQS